MANKLPKEIAGTTANRSPRFSPWLNRISRRIPLRFIESPVQFYAAVGQGRQVFLFRHNEITTSSFSSVARPACKTVTRPLSSADQKEPRISGSSVHVINGTSGERRNTLKELLRNPARSGREDSLSGRIDHEEVSARRRWIGQVDIEVAAEPGIRSAESLSARPSGLASPGHSCL